MSDWLGNEANDKLQMWLYGAIAPLPTLGLGLLWIISRHADLHDKSGTVLIGTDAIALGLTALCLSLALHFHFFWRLSLNPTLKRYSLAGQAASIIGGIIGLLYLTWCFVRLAFL